MPTYHDLEGHIPLMPLKAMKAAHCHLEVAPFDPDSLAIEQSISYLLPARSEHPLEGGTGDVHLLGTLFLFQAFSVFKAYCLGFLHGKANFLQNS